MSAERAKRVRAAAEAHTDLNIFAAIVVLLESSLTSAHCNGAEVRIIRICQAEQEKCLRRYDAATAWISTAGDRS